MKAKLQEKLAKIRETRNFDPKQWIASKCQMLNEYMSKNGLKGVVVNCSGGIDSAVTLMLAKRAQEIEGSPIQRVVALLQPIHSTSTIQNRGLELCEEHKIEHYVIDQTQVFDLLCPTIEKEIKLEGNDFARGQLRSYMRTPVAYYVAQLLSCNNVPSIVIGTGNYDEDGYLYYFCKPGDGTSDIQLIHDLHKSEVKSVAQEIGVVSSIVVAPPSADLWDGQTDEDELGFPYEFCELYTELLHNTEDRDEWLGILDSENKEQWDEWKEKLERVHRRNSHKEVWPINLDICCPTGKNYTAPQ